MKDLAIIVMAIGAATWGATTLPTHEPRPAKPPLVSHANGTTIKIKVHPLMMRSDNKTLFFPERSARQTVHFDLQCSSPWLLMVAKNSRAESGLQYRLSPTEDFVPFNSEKPLAQGHNERSVDVEFRWESNENTELELSFNLAAVL